MMNNEVWKDVLGYEGLYQVSNLGRVKSLNYNKTKEEKVLQLQEYDYIRVQLWKNGNCKFKQVHRLEYEAFYGPIPEGMQVNHINENKHDNRLENLNLMTPKENINWGTGQERAHKKLINHPNTSRMIVQYSLDGKVIKDDWQSQKEIERVLGYYQRNISACCRGKLHTYKGFVWRYKEC